MKHKPKKSLGQNFLKSQDALRKIVAAGEIARGDVVLEIGPGKGALTSKLLGSSGKVIAIEKDANLYEFLKTKFQKEIQSGKLILVNEDILNFNTRTYNLKPSTYKIIANIPYNITGAILKKFLTNEVQPSTMVLMLQKEVGERILGRGKNTSTPLRVKESILSISVKAYGVPSLVAKVPKRYFSPAPKVDSVVVKIEQISRQIFEKEGISEPKFWEIVKTGFSHKRKVLRSNLKTLTSPRQDLWEKLGNRRAEDLTLKEWISLAR